MDRAHVIESLSFEVDFASETDAHALHDRYGDFAAGRGLTVIREVFDEFSAADEVLRLDTLEVDLGETLPVWDEAEAEARLREALRRALGGLARPPATSRAGSAPAVARAAAELELVWTHLHHGLLPWQAGLPSQAAFEALVLRVLTAQGPALARRLRASPAAPRLIGRLARQWPFAAVAQLAGLLSSQAPAGGPAAAGAVATVADIPARPEAWAARLLALATGVDPAADTLDIAGQADAVVSRRGDLALELSAAAWPRLLAGEPAAVRARLQAAGQDGAWRGRLAGLLTSQRRGQLLALWAATADAAFIEVVLDQPQAWRLGAARPAEAVGQALLAALVDHLLLAAGERMDAAKAIAALVTARAAAEGLAPAVVARALAASWPRSGAAGDVGPRLRAAVSARFASEPARGEASVEGRAPSPAGRTDAPATPDEPPPARRWRLDLEPSPQAAQEVRDDVWRQRLRQAPAGLAAQLRARGRTAVQRQSLSRDLTPARLADLLSLWFDPADAAFVEALTAAAEAWAQAATPRRPADLAVRLRGWLLEALLLAPAQGRLAAEAVATHLLRRRADFDDLAPAAAARSLLNAWPAEGPAAAHRARLQEGLEADLADAAATTEPPAAEAGPSQQRRAARAALEQAFTARALSQAEPALREALANDAAWLTATLAERLGDAVLRAALARDLPTALLFALVQPWLSEPAVRLLLAAAPARGPEAEQAFWDDVLAALWRTADGSAAATPMDAAALLRPLLRTSDPQVHRGRWQAVRAARAYVRDTPAAPGAAARTGSLPPPAVPSVATWADRLPERPTAAVSRAVAALLVPPAAGLAQLAGLAPAQRRQLIIRLRPADAPGALAALDALAAAARAAGLPEPAQGWAGFGERVLLRELFEEDRRFAAEGFATRWFAAWLARVSEIDAARARHALASALDLAAFAPAEPAASAHDDVGPAADADTAASGVGEVSAAAPEARPLGPSSIAEASEVGDAVHRDAPPSPVETQGVAPHIDAAATQPRAVPMAPTTTADEPATMATEGAEPPSDPAAAPQAAAQATAAEPRAAEPPNPRVLAEALRAEAVELAADAAAETSGPQPAPEPEADGAIYVDNAGVVLAGPYIPMLFDRLRLTRAGRFVDDHAVERAVHLLQFMVDGEEVPAPEHRLALNKLLCGLDFRIPLGREFRIEDHERETIESLLQAMIERWSIIGRTSVAGLRESFFQRQGALTAEPEAWRLKVQPRAFDMLIDQIPWGFTVQRMPWMAQVLYVDWR